MGSMNSSPRGTSSKFNFAWLVMVGCGLMVAGSISTLTVLSGNFYYAVSADLNVDVSAFSFCATMVILGAVLSMPVVSRVLSKINFRVVLPIFAVVLGAVLALNSQFTEIWQFYVAGFVDGICMGFLGMVTLNAVLGNWFRKKIGFAIGCAWAISSVYVAIMSPAMSTMIEQFGWRTSYLIVGAIAMALELIATVLFVRYKPEDMGMTPYGAEVVDSDGAETVTVEGVPAKKGIFSSAFVLVAAVMMLMQISSVINSLFPTYAEVVGFGAQVGALMISAAMISDIFLNIIIGASCDKLGAFKAIALWTVVTILSLVMMIAVSDSPLLTIVAAAINDSMYVICGVGLSALAIEVFGNLNFDKIYSWLYMLGYGLASFGGPLLLKAFEVTGSFQTVFVICIVLDIIIIGLSYLASRAGKKLPRVTEEITVS